MALQGTKVDRYGVIHTEAYAKVAQTSLNYADLSGLAVVNFYHDQQARLDGKPPFEQKQYSFTSTGIPAVTDEQGNIVVPAVPSFTEMFGIEKLDEVQQNPIKAVYEYIKELAEWDGWQDV